MAAEAYTPIDDIGMPLPLAPTDLETHDASQPKPDWHHHFHPRRSLILTQDWGGDAIRNARVQKANWNTHHLEYHNYYQGPELPDTPAQKFGITVLAVAGYVPEEAIEFVKSEPSIIRLSDGQRNRLLKSGELRCAAPEIVRKFLIEYTVKQEFTDVKDSIIDEFLNTSDDLRRYRLGGTLLNLAVDKAVEPLDPFYRTAWKKGYIHRTSAYRPQRLVRTKLKFKSHQAELINRLHKELDAA